MLDCNSFTAALSSPCPIQNTGGPVAWVFSAVLASLCCLLFQAVLPGVGWLQCVVYMVSALPLVTVCHKVFCFYQSTPLSGHKLLTG